MYTYIYIYICIYLYICCNRVGSANRLRAWVLRFFACSWSPAAGFFKPSGLQRPAHQVRRFCRCRLQETGHIPAASLAPHRPRRVQESKESRRGTHERPLFICNRDYLTKPRLSFVALRYSSRHPDACDICSYWAVADRHT